MGLNFTDQYSLLHFATGIIAYFWGLSFVNWFILHTIFELLENTNKGMFIINKYFGKIWPGGKPYADSALNSVGDTFYAVLGWIVAYLVDYYGNKFGLYQRHIKK